MKFYSPLRYPGGKSKIYPLVKNIIKTNNLSECTYVEPFAGGAGLAIKLLFDNAVKEILINDIDPAIYYFWKAILEETEQFCEMLDNIPISVDEWEKQHNIFKNGFRNNQLEYAFSVFYLNRTNVSGILKGGIIGGKDQTGKYKMDARFNKCSLKERIKNIAEHKKRIIVTNFDANNLLTDGFLQQFKSVFIYFDPPYVSKSKDLYINGLGTDDHRILSNNICGCNYNWIATYDQNDYIKELYEHFRIRDLYINYCVSNHRNAKEYIIFCDELIIPKQIDGE